MIWCFGLLIYGCQLPPTPPPSDSYCQLYQLVVRAAGDGSISAAGSVKKRIAENEVIYRCKCQAWKSPLCPKDNP